MELRDLRAFAAVAEELHFGRAAVRLHMDQPPLSQRIKALEEELGARLFSRTSRSVALTAAGRLFLERARDILARAEEAAEAATAAGRGEAGRLRIGFMGPAMDGPLPFALRDFRERYPKVSLELLEKGSAGQAEDILAGRLDAGFVRLFGDTPRGLAAELFVREPYVAALPSGHALAGEGRIPLAALRDEPFIMFPRRMQPALFDAMMAACATAGFTPRISQEAATKRTSVSLAAAGFGAALVHASSWRSPREGVVYLDIDGELPLVEISVAWREGEAAAALMRFLETVRAHRSIV
jgi:DNA-binding transcriptional LysR family regulator